MTVKIRARLQELRVRAMLTQREVGERMGLRRKDVSRLEKGWIRSPVVGKISRFLQACGASWFELAGVLDTVGALTVSGSKPQSRAFRLKMKEAQRVQEVSERQSRRYQQALGSPTGRKLPTPDKLVRMALRLRDYRVAANVCEQAVVTMLREEPVVPAVYPQYYAVARQLLGTLWRLAKTEAGRDALLRMGGRLPEEVKSAMTSREAFWRRHRLNMELVTRVQHIVLNRFCGLLRNCPQLFGRPEKTRRNTRQRRGIKSRHG